MQSIKKKIKKHAKKFIKMGGKISSKNNPRLRAALCYNVNEKYMAINPYRIKKCNSVIDKGEQICEIKLTRKDPYFGNVIHHVPMPTCVVKNPKQNNKSIKNLYNKGTLNRTTNISELSNIRNKNKKKEENKQAIKNQINKGNFSSFKSPINTWQSLNKQNFSSFKSPYKAWQYRQNNHKKKSVAKNYEESEL